MAFPFRCLREWIDFLSEQGDLVRHQEPVGLQGEVAAVARKIAATESPAVLHENIKHYPGWRVFSDGLTTRRRQLWALNVLAKDSTRLILDKLEKAGHAHRLGPMPVSGAFRLSARISYAIWFYLSNTRPSSSINTSSNAARCLLL